MQETNTVQKHTKIMGKANVEWENIPVDVEWEVIEDVEQGLAEESYNVPWYARYFVNKMKEKEQVGIPLYELDTEGRLRPVDRDDENYYWISDSANQWIESHKNFLPLKRRRHAFVLGFLIMGLLVMLRIFRAETMDPDMDHHHQYTDFDPYVTYHNGTHEFNPLNIIISLNGMNQRLISRERTPFLYKMFKREHDEVLNQNITVSSSLKPQFPLQSFPNMWTMVTGLYPAQHGMVANTFWDSKNEIEFRPGIVDPHVWVESGEPIWETVQKAYNHESKWNYKVYSNMWPGSDVNYTSIPGVSPARQPYYMDLYDAKETMEKKLNKIFSHIDTGSIEDRPQMVLSAINDIDAFGHQHGYPMDEDRFYGEEFHDLLKRVDQFVNDTFTGLHERNLTSFTNVVIVSNHGMADIKFPENVTVWEELIHEERDYLRDNDMISHVYMEGSGLGVYVANPVQINEVFKIIKNRIDNERYHVYLNGNLPKEWNYNSNQPSGKPYNHKNGNQLGKPIGNGNDNDHNSNERKLRPRDTVVSEKTGGTGSSPSPSALQQGIPREPTIWIVPQLGNSIMLKEKYDIVAKRLKKNKKHAEEFYLGSHNFANIDDPALQAIFAATGPFFQDSEIGVISNLDIYNLLCDINGISLKDRNPNNGTTHPLF